MLPHNMEEEMLIRLAVRLSEKPLSVWIHGELRQIKDLQAGVAAQLLTDWEDYKRFVPEKVLIIRGACPCRIG